MNMIKITCPKCSAVGSISLADPSYQGPFKCWKCKELYSISIYNNKLQSLNPINEEELKKLQEIEALKAKYRRPPAA